VHRLDLLLEHGVEPHSVRSISWSEVGAWAEARSADRRTSASRWAKRKREVSSSSLLRGTSSGRPVRRATECRSLGEQKPRDADRALRRGPVWNARRSGAGARGHCCFTVATHRCPRSGAAPPRREQPRRPIRGGCRDWCKAATPPTRPNCLHRSPGSLASSKRRDYCSPARSEASTSSPAPLPSLRNLSTLTRPSQTAGFTNRQHCRWLRSPVVTLLLPVGSGSETPVESPAPCFRSTRSVGGDASGVSDRAESGHPTHDRFRVLGVAGWAIPMATFQSRSLPRHGTRGPIDGHVGRTTQRSVEPEDSRASVRSLV
jgi:hypothetical protein